LVAELVDPFLHEAAIKIVVAVDCGVADWSNMSHRRFP